MVNCLNFTSQIPEKVLQKTEKYLSSNIALFRPSMYLGGIRLNAGDYHFVIPSAEPPDTLLNNKSICINRRKLMAINPGDVVYCSKTTSVKPYYSFLIKQDFLRKIAEQMDFSGEIRFIDTTNAFSGELLHVLSNLEKECMRPDRFKLLQDCLEIQIVTLLLRELRTNTKKFAPQTTDVDSYIRLAIEFMRTYYSSDITIEDICAEIHVSPFHFIRMFKQKVGTSPHQYLIRVRIEKAMELLGSSRYTVAEIAAICGFVSIPHFSSTFREVTGYSPESYKNQ